MSEQIGHHTAAARKNLLLLLTLPSCSRLRLLLLPANEQGDGDRCFSSITGERATGDEARDDEEEDAPSSTTNGTEPNP